MITNPQVLEEINRLGKYGVTLDEMIKKYTITDPFIKCELEYIALGNNGVINESDFNKYGLTPRHIQITFDGQYKAELNY